MILLLQGQKKFLNFYWLKILTQYTLKIIQILYFLKSIKNHILEVQKNFLEILTINNTFDSRSLKIDSFDQNLLETADKLVHFGWKSEAIPVTVPRKSMIARFFAAIFE